MDNTHSSIGLRKRFRESIPRMIGFTQRVLLLLLLGLTPGRGETVAQQLDKRLKTHGDCMVANVPAEVKIGSSLIKAKYVFQEYCAFLNGQRQGLNSQVINQLQGYRYGDKSMLQCGWHTDRLKMLMGRIGVREEDMSGIVADAHSSLPSLLSPNQEHGALAVRDKDGKVYVFDAWQLAYNNVLVSTGINVGAYAGAEKSKWNGMEAKLWDTEMRGQGYVRFNDPTMPDTGYALDVQSVLNRIFGSNQPPGGWVGKWYGVKSELLLEQAGTKVTGRYSDHYLNCTGIVTGTVNEKTPTVLLGTIRILPYDLQGITQPGYERQIKWTLDKNGTRFDCEWGSAGIWHMTRTRPQP